MVNHLLTHECHNMSMKNLVWESSTVLIKVILTAPMSSSDMAICRGIQLIISQTMVVSLT